MKRLARRIEQAKTSLETPDKENKLPSVYAVIIVGAITAGLVTLIMPVVKDYISPLGGPSHEKDLDKYSFPRLKQTVFTPSPVEIGKELDIGVDPDVYQFFFSDNFTPDKKISGSIMLPDEPGTYPVIVLFRGYADREVYYSGYGTKSAAAYFAERGYITVSPDFLGYGASDATSQDSTEARFQTYTTALTLLRSLDDITTALQDSDLEYTLDTENVGIWGHSNGGQISLSVLAITGQNYPTTLWAPVTLAFPDNILFYIEDYDDGGAFVKGLVEKFKESYDDAKFTPTNYLRWIDAPIQLHQGTADEAVPEKWSDSFVDEMNNLDKDIVYFVYEDMDHNMRPAWDTVIQRDLVFFDERLKD